MVTLLTGSSGFLGREILEHLPFDNIITLSRSNAQLKFDLGKEVPVLPQVDLVIHSAGKAHVVPKTEFEKQEFFQVNVEGTRNLLIGLERSDRLPKAIVFISSVAVYGLEVGKQIKETSPLLASDPYGQSKIQAEGILREWCASRGIKFAILRLPLLVGNNPPGNLLAMISAIRRGYYFNIAGGKARKSMVLASDVAKIIPLVASVGGVYNLTDGKHPSFAELSSVVASRMGKPTPLNIPNWLAVLMAGIGDILGKNAPINSKKLKKIMSDLTFDDAKARKDLAWHPEYVLEKFML